MTLCAEAAALAGANNAPQSRRAWPTTRRSASKAVQLLTIGQAEGTPPGHQRSVGLTGQWGEVDKWTEGQLFSDRSVARTENTTSR